MSIQTFLLPDVGEGLTEAEIVSWRVKVGDVVEVNQVIVEIETAKSLVELPSPFAGQVTALLVEPGVTVPVGTAIIEVATQGAQGTPDTASPDPGSTAQSSTPGSGQVSTPLQGQDQAAAQDHTQTAGAGTESGALMVGYGTAAAPEATATTQAQRRRRVHAGPQRTAAPALSAQASAPASVVSVPVGQAGQVPQQTVQQAAQQTSAAQASATAAASVPSAIASHRAMRDLVGPDAGSISLPARRGHAAAPQSVAAQGTVQASPLGQNRGGLSGGNQSGGDQPGPVSGQLSAGFERRILAKPPVRKLALDLGINLSSINPTGPGGIVTREDVIAQAQANQPQVLATYPDDDRPWLASGSVSADGRVTRVPVKSVRKRTAEAMVASAFTAPHVTVFRTVDVTKMMKLVARLKTEREFEGVRVTPLLITAKAVLIALNRHPEMNASWDEQAQEIVYKHYVNLGCAAATARGLVVPNIKDAHRLPLLGLARGLAELTSNARAGKVTPAAMSDGTFTITNVGVLGIDSGTPILNPGEAGILAFGSIRQQPWVHKGKIKPRWITQLALSFDHRLVDGELGARFLADVAQVMEEPARGLVWL